MIQDELKQKVSPITDALLIVIGMVLSILTVFVAFIMCYSVFFEHELFIRRWALWKWLKKNKVEGKKHIMCTQYLIADDIHINRWFDGDVSVHDKSDCLLCGFRGGLLDFIIDRKIKRLLAQ